MAFEWILIASEEPPHAQRFARVWNGTDEQDFRASIIPTIVKRPRHTPVIALSPRRRIAVRTYSSLIFALAFDDPEDETDVFELIHLLIIVLDEYFGCVKESNILKQPEVVVRAVELMVCGGVLVDTNRASIVRRLKHWK